MVLLQKVHGAISLSEGQKRISDARNAMRRLGSALSHARRRIRRDPASGQSGAVWTRGMSWLPGLAILLCLVLAPFDAWVVYRSIEFRDSSFLQMLTRVGLSQYYLIPAALVLIAAGTADWRKRDNRARSRLRFLFGQAAFTVAAVGLSGLLTNTLKMVVGRARPILIDQFGSLHFEPFSLGYNFASFPSGHSTTAGAITAITMLWFPRFRYFFLFFGAAVAATRVGVGSHYPSDVVAGFSLGFLTALVLARWLAIRGLVFRLSGHETLPAPRYPRSFAAGSPQSSIRATTGSSG